MEEFNHLENKPKKRSAYQHAIKLLSKKDYSIHKMTQKLEEKAYPQEEIESTIHELLEKKYLREDLYAEARVKGLMRKGYSPDYIQSRLNEENVQLSLDTIYDIFQEYSLTEEDQIKDLVRKKLILSPIEGKIDFNKKVKILRFLASKGHRVENIDHYL